MTLKQQITYIEGLESHNNQSHATQLGAVKQSLHILMGMHIQVAPKYELYNNFVGAYYNFIIEHSPLFDFTAKDGKALKELIAKLLKCQGISTEQEALEVWQAVLGNWAKLNSFMQSQKSIAQINKYIVEILDQLKNGHYQNKPSAREHTAQNAKSLVTERQQRRASAGGNH